MLAASLLPQTALAQGPPDLIVPPEAEQRYIISFHPGFRAADRAETAIRAGAEPLLDLGLINALAVRIPDINIHAALQANSAVVRIVPDHKIFAIQARPRRGIGGSSDFIGVKNTESTSSGEVVPAGVKRVGEPVTGAEGAGVGIMIADTGIDWEQPDLNVAADRFDAFGGNCKDRNGHGTHVAGTAAALMNGSGVVGVAPGGNAILRQSPG